MPAPLRAWYSLRDIETLAHRRAVLSGDIKISQFKRLRDLLYAENGSVRVDLRFEPRGEGWQALQLRYATAVRLLCQRCLEPAHYRLEGEVELGVVPTAAMEAALPEGIEPLVLEGERLCPVDLLEDELIVALPLVARHGEGEHCESLVEQFEHQAASAGTLGPPTTSS
jgi:uncharacterized protein